MNKLQKKRLNQWMSNYSLEVSAKESAKFFSFERPVPKNTKIYFPHIQGKSFEDEVIKPAHILSELGYTPVAHLAARNLKDEAELESCLKKLTERVPSKEILLLGGGNNPPAGKICSVMDMLNTGLFQKYGFHSIGVAGHPEKHPEVSDKILLDSLEEKYNYVKKNKLEFYILTQFCFTTEPIMDWLGKLEKRGIKVPIRLGVMGIVGIISLIKYAIHCGVLNSLQVIKNKYKSIHKMALKYHNEEFFLPMLEALGENYPNVEGLHVFSFGSSEKSTVNYFKDWLERTRI